MPNIKKPAALHILAGNPSNRPIKPEPDVGDLSLTPPANMSKRAKIVFKELARAMPPGVFKKTDKHLLVAYCEQVASHEEAVKKIERDGSVVNGSQGQLVVSPWVRIRNEAAGKIVTLGARLGLSPTDRANVNAPEQGVEINPFLH
jgi:P27 family predicted phage terminase small subunit